MVELLNQLTFEEKCLLLTGAQALNTNGCERLGIPVVDMSDGPHGIRRLLGHRIQPQKCNIKGGDVCFPTASAVGATWNRELAYKSGQGIARDCVAEGVKMLLAPGVNMKRTPRCGRNFEYFSEDPYLSGYLGAAFINGVQSEGVGTSLKHYAVNSQEIERGTINAEVDERTLREYYLKPFQIITENSEPTSVMCAYNKVNSIWCAENKWLLSDLLKGEWGYKGMVVSDWNAVKNICKSIKAGLDLQMPRNPDIAAQIKAGIENGEITEADLDRAVTTVLEWIEKIYKMHNDATHTPYDRKAQHQIAYEGACECITLLKNKDSVLPIDQNKYKKIAVIGKCADETLFMGGGSSRVTVELDSVDKPIECIRNVVNDGVTVDYFPRFGGDFTDESIMFEIRNLAPTYDLGIVFVGDNYGVDCETENFDRDNLNFPNYINGVMEKATEGFPKSVLVIQSGGAMIPIRPRKIEEFDAILQMWYSGEAGGQAIADILFGKVNPSGKLSESFMLKERTDLDWPGDGTKLCYSERQNVGYRYYDKHTDEIWYPFGHGLSYTTFEYSDLEIDRQKINSDKFEITVKFKLTNTGKCKGKEAVQLYIAPKNPVADRPLKELRAFEKLELEVGESKTVEFKLTQKEFAYYNICLKDWHIESDRYDILIAASSQDIRLRDSVVINYAADYTKFKNDGSMVL